MPLPSPQLDDRSFQQIVDEAKRQIPRLCPEWTDHNVSDPGVALIELFAWMTEMLLYRVNQVPEKNYIKFLEMIGVRPDPPRPARAPVTFYLSKPLATPSPGQQEPVRTIKIEQDTEVATIRTETSPAITFSTEADLVIRPPAPAAEQYAFQRFGSTARELEPCKLKDDDSPLLLFSFNREAAPEAGSAFYLALKDDHSHHVMALRLTLLEGATGIKPGDPPRVWQVWQGGLAGWADCAIEHDGTNGFTLEEEGEKRQAKEGNGAPKKEREIVLQLPAMEKTDFAGVSGYWLRCLLTDPINTAERQQGRYQTSPIIARDLKLESRGGTVGARQAVTVQNEFLGTSDGTPNQRFKLFNTPILARDLRSDFLIVERPGAPPETWREARDFADSNDKDQHFTLDSQDGTLTLGPALLQPDGRVYRFGAVPAKDSRLFFSRYQTGGGLAGNVAKREICVLKAATPYVARVTNWEPALGGRDQQSLDDAKLEAVRRLRARTRAVTAEDFEYHAARVPGVAKAFCPPRREDAGEGQRGVVFVYVLPELASRARPHYEDLDKLPAEKREAVRDYLKSRCVLGTEVAVHLPQIVWVKVDARLRLTGGSNRELAAEVCRRAETELYGYLNPYLGGPRGEGWPIGRSLHRSELYSLLLRLPAVEYVESLSVLRSEGVGWTPTKPAEDLLTLPANAVLCSGEHAPHSIQTVWQQTGRDETFPK